MLPLSQQTFNKTCGFILVFTACCKLVSIAFVYNKFKVADPFFSFATSRAITLAAVVLELFTAFLIFRSKNGKLKSISIAWISNLFLVYRIGLWSVGYEPGCACLGYYAESWLAISSSLHVDWILKAILCYMLAGSIFYLCANNKRSKAQC